MTVGQGGIGFVWMRPIACNDQWSVAFTNASSTGGLSTAVSAMGVTSIAYLANCPYTAAMFGNDEILARNTSIGVRIKYTGELMSRNGVVYTFEHPDRQNLDSWTIQEIIDSNFAKQQAVLGKKWDAAVCASGPISPQNLEYTADPFQGSSHVWTGIIVTGKPGDTYMVDYANRTEYIGSSASQKTPTRPAGGQFGSVVAAVKDTVLATGPLKPTDTRSAWDKFKDYVSETVPVIADGVKIAGGLMSTAVTGNPAGIFAAAQGAVNMANHFSGLENRGAVKEIGFGSNKLAAHQVQATKHHGVKDVKNVGAAHVFTPFDPLVRDMFDWCMINPEESAYYSFLMKPKSEKFMKPFDLIFASLSAEQIAIGGYLWQVNEVYYQIVCNPDWPTITHAEVLAYYDLVQDLLDAYFGDDVPPDLSKKDRVIKDKEEKPIEKKKLTSSVVLTYYPIAFEPSDEFKKAKADLIVQVQQCFPNLEILGIISDKNSLEDMYCIEAIGGERTKYNPLPEFFLVALAKEKKRQNDLFLMNQVL